MLGWVSIVVMALVAGAVGFAIDRRRDGPPPKRNVLIASAVGTVLIVVALVLAFSG